MKTIETIPKPHYELDASGLPLHPWDHCRNTLPEGKGSFYRWGPNYTADPIVITNNTTPFILLIERSDTGNYALPGGFVDSDEDAITAATRELMEETHYAAPYDSPQLIYSGPVEDHRSTRNAWPETTALLWQVDDESTVVGDDDATIACWIPLRELRRINKFHGSHRALIEMAIMQHGTPMQKLEYFGSDAELDTPSGGHMGYDRTVATLPTGERLFVKSHNPSHFTDNTREAHSRTYLEKEHHTYQSLQTQFPHIPHDVTLHNDTALYMEAYDSRDGWHWRLPSDLELASRYMNDTLQALAQLESVAIPRFPSVPPSYQEILEGGWPRLTDRREIVEQLLLRVDTDDAVSLRSQLDDYLALASIMEHAPLDCFAHYDIHQSNIAWHSEHGTRIVDWSWADAAPRGFDTTSFLIDIAKSGYEITPYRHLFCSDHALTLMGFWLVRATEPNYHGTNVRDQQLLSAITAHSLLQQQPSSL